MSTSTEKLAVVVLSYNGKHLLEELLPKTIAHTPTHGDYKIYVVDNGSDDGTFDFVSTQFPEVELIRIENNKGFTNGYAVALAQIKSKYYVLVSSDVEVSEGWIEPVMELMDSDEKIAVVQPKIKSYYERDAFEYAGACGGYIDHHGYPFCRGRIFGTVEKDTGQYESIEEVFWASGACFFIRADVYHQTGGLDDDFFAHMEEIDLCWRIKNYGYKIMVCPQSEVYHMGGAIITYGSPQKVYRNHRNNLIMMVKNLPGTELIWKIPLRLIMDGLAFAKMVIDGNLKASFSILRAHLSFYRYTGKWLRKRRAIQQTIDQHTKSGIFPESIVKAHFIKGVGTFDRLNWKP